MSAAKSEKKAPSKSSKSKKASKVIDDDASDITPVPFENTGKSSKSMKGKGEGGKSEKKDRGNRSPSQSPDRGRGGSRGRGRSRSKSRSNSPSRRRAKGGDTPKDWSKEQLLEKIRPIGQFQFDRKAGTGSFHCSGRRLMDADVAVIHEMCRRYTEIQSMVLTKLSLTDESLLPLFAAFKQIRHLKTLDLSFNGLTTISCAKLCKHYGSLSRKLEVLDLRYNALEDQDGHLLYRTFGATIEILNGINIRQAKKREKCLDLTKKSLKSPDVAILCSLLEDPRAMTLEDIKLGKNYINSKGSLMLTETVAKKVNINHIDLSNNPITDGDRTLAPLEKWMNMVALKNHIYTLRLDGINVPENILSRINRSLQVNRSIKKSHNPSFFVEYCQERIDEGRLPPPVNKLAKWEAEWVLDGPFAKVNRVVERRVEFRGDEIVIVKVDPGKRRGAFDI